MLSGNVAMCGGTGHLLRCFPPAGLAVGAVAPQAAVMESGVALVASAHELS